MTTTSRFPAVFRPTAPKQVLVVLAILLGVAGSGRA